MNNNDEYIVVVDQEDNIIGKKLRSLISKEDIYRVSSLWVFNSNKELLIAQRPSWKKHDPGKWTESAVGTVEDGETYESNLIKEAKEELGLDLSKKDLVFITKDFYESKNGKMFGAIYAVILNEDMRIDVNKHEVPDIEWISYEEVVKELNKVDIRFVGGFDKYYFQVWNKIKNL